MGITMLYNLYIYFHYWIHSYKWKSWHLVFNRCCQYIFNLQYSSVTNRTCSHGVHNQFGWGHRYDHGAAEREIEFLYNGMLFRVHGVVKSQTGREGARICALSWTSIKREFCCPVGCSPVFRVQENGVQVMMWIPRYVVWISSDLVIFILIFL